MEKFYIYIILGAPSSGKGTQSHLIVENYPFYHFSLGDELRMLQKDSSNLELKKKINDKMSTGQLIDNSIVFEVFKQKLSLILTQKQYRGVIIDGFPRSEEQADCLDETLKELDLSLSKVINLDVSDEEVVSRAINRFTCGKCGRIYNKLTSKPKVENQCDGCLFVDSFTERTDDKESVIKNRVKVFNEIRSCLFSRYESDIFITIDGTQKADDIFEQIKGCLPEN